jgi:hypothetical protein
VGKLWLIGVRVPFASMVYEEMLEVSVPLLG